VSGSGAAAAQHNPAVTLVETSGAPPYYAFRHLQADGTAFCGFSTRLGGVSSGPYASLNLGSTTADAWAHVEQNRRCLEAAYGYPLTEWIRLEHGNQVHVVDEAVLAARQADPSSPLPSADAVITCLEGVALTIYYADCVPVVIVDPVRRALGVVHAGWRGTLAGATSSAVQAMVERFGCEPADMLAGLGSSIGPCCFEVGADVIEQVRQRLGAWQESVMQPLNGTLKGAAEVRDERARVDLWQINALQLEAAGLLASRIQVSRLCTACQPALFYSYRRDRRVTGRLAMTAVLLRTQV
jgi:polyphenol oxidase